LAAKRGILGIDLRIVTASAECALLQLHEQLPEQGRIAQGLLGEAVLIKPQIGVLRDLVTLAAQAVEAFAETLGRTA
jgi:hypothetical protein